MRTRLRLVLETLRRRLRTTGYLLILVAANIAGITAPAAAADDTGSAGSTVWRWMDVTDSQGHSAWGYSMSLDYGGLTDTGNALFGGITGLCWFIYQFLVILSIWLINFALSLEWFTPLEQPAQNIADSLQSLLDSVELTGLFLALTAVAVGCLLVLGTNATAVFEVVVALVILTLGTGVFANPVDKAFGSDNDNVVDTAHDKGWLAQTSAAGLEVAGSIQHGGRTSATADTDKIRENISQQLVDVFLRNPHQLINYGKILDNTKCADAYNKSLDLGPPPPVPDIFSGHMGWGSAGMAFADPDKIPDPGDAGWSEYDSFIRYYLKHRSTLGKEDPPTRKELESGDKPFSFQLGDAFTDPPEPREIVAECDKAAGDRAENPSPGMAGDSATIVFGVFALLGFAALLAFTLIYLGIQFLWCALRSIWDFIVGLAPGNARNPLWQTLASAIWALIGTFATSIILVTFLMAVTKVAGAFDDSSIMAGFAMLDLLLFAMLLLFWRLRKRMREAADRTAQMMSKRPGRKPMKMPARGMSPSQAVATYYGGRAAIKGGARVTKLGASAVTKGAKVGLVGTGVGAVAGGVGAFKATRGAGRTVKRAFARIGMAGRLPQNNNTGRGKPPALRSGERPALPPGPDGPHPHRGTPPGLQQRMNDLKDRRDGGTSRNGNQTGWRRRPPGTSGGRTTNQNSNRNLRRHTQNTRNLGRRSSPRRPNRTKPRATPPTSSAARPPRGTQSGGIQYRRIISSDGQIIHVPVDNDEDDE